MYWTKQRKQHESRTFSFIIFFLQKSVQWCTFTSEWSQTFSSSNLFPEKSNRKVAETTATTTRRNRPPVETSYPSEASSSCHLFLRLRPLPLSSLLFRRVLLLRLPSSWSWRRDASRPTWRVPDRSTCSPQRSACSPTASSSPRCTSHGRAEKINFKNLIRDNLKCVIY